MSKLIHSSRTATHFVLALGLTACVGKAPEPGGDSADVDAGLQDEVDGAPIEEAIQVTGVTRDYQEAMVGQEGVLQNGAIATEGLDPALEITSGTDGAFILDELPPGSVFYAAVTIPEPLQYRPTRNSLLTVAEASVAADLYALSEAFVSINYAGALGEAALPEADSSIVIIDLYRNNGTPLVGIPLENVSLTDGDLKTVLDLEGAPIQPYFFNLTGNMDSEQLTSVEAPLGKARVGFLNVPPGTYQVNVAYENNQGQLMDLPPTTITTIANGATINSTQASAGAGDGGGGGGGGGEKALNFVDDIYPDLQKASQGGLSCAVCHTAGGLNPNLQFDLPAADVYQALVAIEGAISVAVPAESLLLTKPLYEVPANHPNATFADINNPSYQKWLQWITEGALQTAPAN
jgi:hypothetical protein